MGKYRLKRCAPRKALSQILQGQDIDYEVKDNHIVLSKRNSTKNNQTFTVVGQVTDEKGVPLIGVNITAKGHGNTVTDIDGNYSIKSRTGYRSCVFLYRISARIGQSKQTKDGQCPNDRRHESAE